MPAITLDRTVRVSDDVVFREIDGEGIVLNLDSGIYFGLNVVGTRAWRFIDEHTGSLADVCTAIVAEFDVDYETAARDLTSLVAELKTHGLIEVA